MIWIDSELTLLAMTNQFLGRLVLKIWWRINTVSMYDFRITIADRLIQICFRQCGILNSVIVDKTENRFLSEHHAQVAELVDALVSGTSGECRGGSSPLLGTKYTSTAVQGHPEILAK